MEDQKGMTLHRLLLLGSVLAFALAFFFIVLQFHDNLDAEFTYRELEDGTIAIEGYTGSPKKLVIPNEIDGKKVTEIYSNAFSESEDLKEVTISENVRRIGEYAFHRCLSLKKVTISEGVLEIERAAFAGCAYLTNVDLPSGLQIIGEESFRGCTRLKSVTIPASCEKIGEDAFFGCELLVMDCSENDIAEAYAKKASIPTDFSDSQNGMYAMIAISVIIPLAIFLAANFLWKARKNKKENAMNGRS